MEYFIIGIAFAVFGMFCWALGVYQGSNYTAKRIVETVENLEKL